MQSTTFYLLIIKDESAGKAKDDDAVEGVADFWCLYHGNSSNYGGTLSRYSSILMVKINIAKKLALFGLTRSVLMCQEVSPQIKFARLNSG